MKRLTLTANIKQRLVANWVYSSAEERRKRALILLAGLLFIALGLFWPWPASAAEPICQPFNDAYHCPDGTPAFDCNIGALYHLSMQFTNRSCEARKKLDDDLFVPLMAYSIYGEDIRNFMPKFRADVQTLKERGLLDADYARRLHDLALKIERSKP